jgi:hypothetical protein
MRNSPGPVASSPGAFVAGVIRHSGAPVPWRRLVGVRGERLNRGNQVIIKYVPEGIQIRIIFRCYVPRSSAWAWRRVLQQLTDTTSSALKRHRNPKIQLLRWIAPLWCCQLCRLGRLGLRWLNWRDPINPRQPNRNRSECSPAPNQSRPTPPVTVK